MPAMARQEKLSCLHTVMPSMVLPILLAVRALGQPPCQPEYSVSNKNGLGRVFDGIGGLSAGAVSRFEPHRGGTRIDSLLLLVFQAFVRVSRTTKIPVAGLSVQSKIT